DAPKSENAARKEEERSAGGVGDVRDFSGRGGGRHGITTLGGHFDITKSRVHLRRYGRYGAVNNEREAMEGLASKILLRRLGTAWFAY
ncbi:hypothetical protein E4U34_000470, partial [Claviceps purpurea]